MSGRDTFISSVILLFVYLVVWTGIVSVLAFWTQHELSFWVSYTKGVPTAIPYWQAFVASILFPIAFVLDFISFIVRMFV